jgi:plastocyanin
MRLLICVIAAFVLPVDAMAATYDVVIEQMRFDPPTLAIARGDRVVWINKDLFPHTATADANVFDSHDIAADTSWSYMARETGCYAYSCKLHPTMRAVLNVR